MSASTQQEAKDYDFDIATPDSPEWLRQLEQRLESNARRAEENSADFEQRLFEYLPQLVFILVPLLALLVQLCYLGKPYHYLQHLVFTLHLNCFMFTVAIVGTLLDELAGWDLEKIMLPLVFIYMPLALKRTYGDSLGMAIVKGFLIQTGNGFFVIGGLAGLSVLALATL